MNKTELKTTSLLGSIFALRMLGLFMIFPIFSLYAEHLAGATPMLMGVALGIYGLTQALFQLPFGLWSDFTERKKVIAIGLLIFAFGSILAALSHNITTMILGRALQGAGAIGSTVIALVGDLTAEEHRTKAMAIVGIMIGCSFVLAMVTGPAIAHLIGMTGIFWITALFALGGLLLLRSIPSPTTHERDFNLTTLKKQLGFVLTHPKLRQLNLSIFIIHALLTATFLALPMLLIQQGHLKLNQQWQLYVPVFALTVLIIGGIMRSKNFRKQETQWLIRNAILLCVAQLLFLLSITHTVLFLYIGLYLLLQSFTFLEALLPSLVSQTISSDFRGCATGVFSSCQFLGIFAGGLWGGFLNQQMGFSGIFVGNLFVALLWLYLLRGKEKVSHSHLQV